MAVQTERDIRLELHIGWIAFATSLIVLLWALGVFGFQAAGEVRNGRWVAYALRDLSWPAFAPAANYVPDVLRDAIMQAPVSGCIAAGGILIMVCAFGITRQAERKLYDRRHGIV